MLQDIAILTGGQVISEEVGLTLEDVEITMLGEAASVTVTKDTTTLVSEKGNKADIQKRVEQLKKQLAETDSEYDKEKLQERIAKLVGGVAVIKVGAATETELKDRKLRFEDALNATKAAVAEGIVPGGGVTLLHLASRIDALLPNLNPEEQTGCAHCRQCLATPVAQIADNAGVEGAVVVENVRAGDFNYGFNAASGTYEDLVSAGIIDPAKVVRSALQNAGSIAGMVLTTEALVVEKPQPKAAAPADGGMM